MIHHKSIPNFRPVSKKLHCLYRSASPEDVASVLQDDPVAGARPKIPHEAGSAESVLLNEVTLWIDMRFPSEINQEKISSIAQNAPGGTFEKLSLHDPRGLDASLHSVRKQRTYLYWNDPSFSMDSILGYAAKNWLSADAMDGVISIEQQKALVMKALSDHGLEGLFECILERYNYIFLILQSITLHLEQQRADGEKEPTILFHCTLGKDRTGLISMMCQSMMGESDDDIIEEFVKSHCVEDIAYEKMRPHFGAIVDSSNFARAEADTMRKTLLYLRMNPTYRSVDGYLDCIGFDASWRRRFLEGVFGTSQV